jgi:hypothetical protein
MYFFHLKFLKTLGALFSTPVKAEIVKLWCLLMMITCWA